MNTIDELRACLALQDEIDAKTRELRLRYKAVLEEQREKGNQHNVTVEIDGSLYVLDRENNSAKWHREVMKATHELGGFYFYRLTKVAEPIR